MTNTTPEQGAPNLGPTAHVPSDAVAALSTLVAGAQSEIERLVVVRDDAMRTHVLPITMEIRRLEEQLKLAVELQQTLGVEVAYEPRIGRMRPDMLLMREDAPIASIEMKRYGGSTVRDRVQANVREILEAAGGEMHINDIHAQYIERGWAVPGLGKPANLSVHLMNADGIRSTRRGYYALGEAGQPKSINARSSKKAVTKKPTGSHKSRTTS